MERNEKMRRFFLKNRLHRRMNKEQKTDDLKNLEVLQEAKESDKQEIRKKHRKIRYRMFAVANLVIIALLVWQLWMFKEHMAELNNQLTYLLDTNNIIQGDLSTLQADIKSTLEEEASLIANYSITTTDVDFAAGTYSVAVTVTPKEYTDKTEAIVYFGTTQYELEMGNHEFTGNMTFPLTDSYDGNVTFLFMNGEKKSTEVLKKYIGYPHAFDAVLHGKLEKFPTYKDGKLQIEGATQYTLEGNDTFEFDSCDIVVTAGGTEIYRGNLLDGSVIYSTTQQNADNGGADADGSDGNTNPVAGSDGDNDGVTVKSPQDILNNIIEPDTEDAVAAPEEIKPMTASEGEYTITDLLDVAQGTEVQITLQAKAKDGFTFNYVIFKGSTAEADPEKPEDKVDGWVESEDYLPYTYTVMDRKGGILSK